MRLKNALTVNNFARHKRRFDRGGIYINYLTAFFTGGTFLRVFGITQWWAYVIGALFIFVARYYLGYADEQSKTLKYEQTQYTKENDEWSKLMKEMADLKDYIIFKLK